MTGPNPSHRTLLSQSDEAEIHRMQFADGETLVVKAFREPWPTELRAYGLLTRLGVPTLRHLVQPPHLILLEDLERSRRWRLATVTDLATPETGAALAQWYRTLHQAGACLAAERGRLPDWLPCEAELVTHCSVLRAASKLGVARTAGIQAALAVLPRLLAAYSGLAQTLTYNDFFWTNLAVSRHQPTEALMFDLHLMGRGPACADVRNVVGSLEEGAREAFLAAIGPTDPREAALDRPIATLHGLVVAAERPRVPAWARALCRQACDGTLAADVAAALEAAEAAA